MSWGTELWVSRLLAPHCVWHSRRPPALPAAPRRRRGGGCLGRLLRVGADGARGGGGQPLPPPRTQSLPRQGVACGSSGRPWGCFVEGSLGRGGAGGGWLSRWSRHRPGEERAALRVRRLLPASLFSRSAHLAPHHHGPVLGGVPLLQEPRPQHRILHGLDVPCRFWLFL